MKARATSSRRSAQVRCRIGDGARRLRPRTGAPARRARRSTTRGFVDDDAGHARGKVNRDPKSDQPAVRVTDEVEGLAGLRQDRGEALDLVAQPKARERTFGYILAVTDAIRRDHVPSGRKPSHQPAPLVPGVRACMEGDDRLAGPAFANRRGGHPSGLLHACAAVDPDGHLAFTGLTLPRSW